MKHTQWSVLAVDQLGDYLLTTVAAISHAPECEAGSEKCEARTFAILFVIQIL